MRKFFIAALSVTLILCGAFAYVLMQAESSHGPESQEKIFQVKSGENAWELSKRLEAEGFVVSRLPMMWEFYATDKLHSLVAGQYRLSGNMTIPEIAETLSGTPLSTDIRITIPEGWTSQKIAERFKANGLPGDEFLALVKNPKPEWRTAYPFLAELPKDASLEGYLFPDTYNFGRQSTAAAMVESLLKNWNRKVDVDTRNLLKQIYGSTFQGVTLASIVENEVQSDTDRKMVSDIFRRRLQTGLALQSDATVKYILGKDVIQHSFEETRTASPYNTYINKGLPPGPISNPGLSSLLAAAHPSPNSYVYFLSDPKTGETVYAVTFDDHVKNKAAHGL